MFYPNAMLKAIAVPFVEYVLLKDVLTFAGVTLPSAGVASSPTPPRAIPKKFVPDAGAVVN
jgi:hypothetical protein